MTMNGMENKSVSKELEHSHRRAHHGTNLTSASVTRYSARIPPAHSLAATRTRSCFAMVWCGHDGTGGVTYPLTSILALIMLLPLTLQGQDIL